MPVIPKSTSEHRKQGTFRADRHAPKALTPIRTPNVPDWLTGHAKSKWQEIAKLLANAGVITQLDLDALTAYCVAYSQWRAALEHIALHGIAYDSEGGLQKQNPACGVAREMSKELAHWGGVLGLSPLARRKLRVEPATDSDGEKARFFTRSA